MLHGPGIRSTDFGKDMLLILIESRHPGSQFFVSQPTNVKKNCSLNLFDWLFLTAPSSSSLTEATIFLCLRISALNDVILYDIKSDH